VLLFGATLFLGSLLMFAVEPMVAKEDLDREHEALMLENGRLEEEHRKLEGSSDAAATRSCIDRRNRAHRAAA